jgi:cold shock CspA family protein
LRFQGKLTNWNDDKGYGFVEPNDGGDRSFVHIKSFKQISRRPVEGDLIIYEQVKEAKEKYKAVNISLVRDRKPHKNTAPQRRTIGTVIVVSFCLLMVALV